jgi:DNA topoisomerase-2
MAIWSLTQERVEKLLKQIGDKELEVDALIKLSPKDIWTQDLDDFVAEWNTQIEEEGNRAKKMAKIVRRGSNKLGIGAPKGGKRKKKRSEDSDSDSQSDYGPVKKKAKPKTGGLLSYLHQDDEQPKKPSATAALKGGAATAKKQTGMSDYLKKETPPVVDLDDSMDIDEPASAPVPALAPEPVVAATKRARPAATKAATKPKPLTVDSESDSDVFAAVAKEAEKKPATTITNSRTARGATKKATNYRVDKSESEASDDDDFDVSNMVQTIGGSSNARPLFSTTARPGSNGSIRPGSATGGPAKINGRGATQKPSPIEDDPDETNYEGLLPQGSPHKPAPRNVNDTIMGSDDSDDLGFGIKKKAVTKPAVNKAVSKLKVTKAAPKPKPPVSSAVVAKKTTQLSPAAKAYAARLGKTKDLVTSKPSAKAKKPTAIESDDEDMEDADQLANELLSDDEDEDEPAPKPAAARPGRRAAAKPARYVVSDDDEDSDAASEPSFEEDDSE